MTWENIGTVDDPANPSTITCESTLSMTFGSFNQEDMDHGVTVLHKVENLRDDDALGSWQGEMHSDVNPDGQYGISFDVIEDNPGDETFILENVVMWETCPCGHTMRIEFTHVEGERIGNQVSNIDLTMSYETTTGLNSMVTELWGEINEENNYIEGEYDISLLDGTTTYVVDNGQWGAGKIPSLKAIK